MLDKMIIVTGGAGFIGSCMVRTLNDRGITNIIVVDNIASTEKWKNLRNKKYIEYVPKTEFIERLQNKEFGKIEAIVHMGACSSTTEINFDFLWENNVQYTKKLWNYCVENEVQFIYASSAATYGDGTKGFDDTKDINDLLPLNGYGYSKQVFDQWVEKQIKKPKQFVGLKFFNVYGPNEYYKGNMASMVFHGFKQIQQGGEIKLFKSYNVAYQDGEQLRDFIYVKDVCNVICYFIDHSEYSGLFNVGTGKAQSFGALAVATFEALGIEPNIKYIDMPEHLREKYQYYTQARIDSLRKIGYKKDFSNVKSGIFDYVQEYLSKNYENY